jgi:hypothetical protein
MGELNGEFLASESRRNETRALLALAVLLLLGALFSKTWIVVSRPGGDSTVTSRFGAFTSTACYERLSDDEDCRDTDGDPVGSATGIWRGALGVLAVVAILMLVALPMAGPRVGVIVCGVLGLVGALAVLMFALPRGAPAAPGGGMLAFLFGCGTTILAGLWQGIAAPRPDPK